MNKITGRTKVLIQGRHGSFHEMAAFKMLPEAEIIPAKTFTELFKRFNNGEADYAVVATMNSNFGDIDPMYREMTRHLLDDEPTKNKFWIAKTTTLDVHQNLIGLPGADLKDIKHVHSMSPALAQASEYLDKFLPEAEKIEEDDTAESVKLIMRLGDISHAAVASEAAAKLYGAKILKKSIQNDKDNRTRFALLSRELTSSPDDTKVSLVLETSNTAGSLYRALGLFAENNINLAYLRSQTIPGADFRQMFYVDADCVGQLEEMRLVIEQLKLQDDRVTVLGFYKEI
jgi:prephenate dehydratase